jgi:hypothetical protein
LQYLRTLLTSSVVLGFRTRRVWPRYLCIQSLLKASRSSEASDVRPSITAEASPRVDLKKETCSGVTSENFESRLRDG